MKNSKHNMTIWDVHASILLMITFLTILLMVYIKLCNPTMLSCIIL